MPDESEKTTDPAEVVHATTNDVVAPVILQSVTRWFAVIRASLIVFGNEVTDDERWIGVRSVTGIFLVPFVVLSAAR